MSAPRMRRRSFVVAAWLVVMAVAIGAIVVFGTDRGDDSRTSAPRTDTTSTSTSVDPTTTTTGTDPSPPVPVDPAITDAVRTDGTARVIVEIAVDPSLQGRARTDAIAARIDEVRASLPDDGYEGLTTSEGEPYFAVTVDVDALDALTADGSVRAMRLSRRLEPAEVESLLPSNGLEPTSTNATAVEGATAAWASGAKGAGATVAVVDTGVDVSHPFLTATPKTVWEGCFASPGGAWETTCPGDHSMTVSDAPVPGSAAPCPSTKCDHGTHVAGIAVGGTGTTAVSGVAPAADLVAVQVFAYDPIANKIGADEFDVFNALRWLDVQRATFTGLASVNLSLGDGVKRTGYCDGALYKPAIDSLRTHGIATVVASGNNEWSDGVSSPGCISTAVTVGAVDDTSPTVAAYFSNSGMQLDLMAPGVSICSSVPTGRGSNCTAPAGGPMQYKTGTSMATPAVSGGFALLAGEGVGPGDRLAALRRVASGGRTVTAAAWQVPQLRLDVALGLTPAASLVGVTPARIMDTRSTGGRFAGGETRELKVVGVGGVPVSGAVAVALNVTVDQPSSVGYLTVYPTGATQPTSSNLNFVAGETIPNMVIVPVGTGGSISIYDFVTASTHVIVDVVGWATDVADLDAPLVATGVAPQRLLDTRAGQTTIDGTFNGTGPIGPSSSLSLPVTGRGTVPSSGVGSVVLNVTAAGSTGAGFLTVHPAGSVRPTASNLNFLPGQVIPNLVLAKVGTGGRVEIFNSLGSTDVVVDVLGWFPADTTTFRSIVPKRFMDTRVGQSTFDGQSSGQGAIGAGQTRTVQITGRGGVVPTTVSAVALNVTATGPTANGYLTVHPSDVARPTASNLNFVAGETIANSVIARVGADGRIAIYNFAGSTDVIVDVVGWFP